MNMDRFARKDEEVVYMHKSGDAEVDISTISEYVEKRAGS